MVGPGPPEALTAASAKSGRTVVNIQYLRAVAALLVVFHHARNPSKWLFDAFANLEFGARGVDIFFVISGFHHVFRHTQ